MPDLAALLTLFPSDNDIRSLEFIRADQLPSPYRELLVHTQHMTVTVEAHYGSLVDVQVLEDRLEGDTYARKILLSLHDTKSIVQYGLVRIGLNYVSPEVRREITSRQTPLGRILIQHNV